MKVIILGACGGMGRYVAKSISLFNEIDDLAVADLNLKDAELFASQLGNHTKGIQVDINDTESLLRSSINRKIIIRKVNYGDKYKSISLKKITEDIINSC